MLPEYGIIFIHSVKLSYLLVIYSSNYSLIEAGIYFVIYICNFITV
jgi:hypothetical protein